MTAPPGLPTKKKKGVKNRGNVYVETISATANLDSFPL